MGTCDSEEIIQIWAENTQRACPRLRAHDKDQITSDSKIAYHTKQVPSSYHIIIILSKSLVIIRGGGFPLKSNFCILELWNLATWEGESPDYELLTLAQDSNFSTLKS